MNLRETSLPGPRPLEFGYGDTLASCPGCSLFHLEWEWVGQTEGGCRRQDSEHAGNRLESILSKHFTAVPTLGGHRGEPEVLRELEGAQSEGKELRGAAG